MILDLFGRLENESALTASNVAKYDALHTMIIFKEHPPSNITKVIYQYKHVIVWRYNKQYYLYLILVNINYIHPACMAMRRIIVF